MAAASSFILTAVAPRSASAWVDSARKKHDKAEQGTDLTQKKDTGNELELLY